jgi:hypothetical protein
VGRLLAGSAVAVLAASASADFYQGLEAYDHGDFEQAHAVWLPLAEAGDASAQANLAVLYLRGRGVERDPVAAARWFRLAAEQGNPIAQDNLGQLYYKGEGVEKDLEEAARWIRAAAYQGDPSAQLRLGTLYAEGLGVAQDAERARIWWKKSAAQGNARAQARLGVGPEPPEGAGEPPGPAAREAAAPAARSGGPWVQVAAVFAEEDVKREWRRLQRRNPQLLGDLDLDVQRVELGGRVVHRLRAGPLPDRPQAEALCERLEERGVGCLIRTATPQKGRMRHSR